MQAPLLEHIVTTMETPLVPLQIKQLPTRPHCTFRTHGIHVHARCSSPSTHPPGPAPSHMQASAAGCLRSLGRVEEALNAYREAAACRLASLGADHHLTLQVLNHQAVCLDKLGRTEEAETLYRSVLQRK